MDPKTQSTFIPRKSMVDATLPSRTAVGVFSMVSFAIFIVAAVLAGVLFGWDRSLIAVNAGLQNQLNTYNSQLTGPAINDLVDTNNRIAAASSGLQNHFAISAIFNLLSSDTLENVRWNSFSFQDDPQAGLTLTLSGQAKGFADVALQSDNILSDPRFVNPLFADVALGAGNSVTFSLKTSIDPNVVSYSKLIQEENAAVAPGGEVENASSSAASSSTSTTSTTSPGNQ